ncbi:DsbA family protein [Rhodoferax saidenbachensis]|uniref:DsbA family protein n=1 Tax=Rhodoferax saidenbachensis TaxID=1484693 RepID=A0A1P8K9P6_9BURK|nr:DsbA family protein [Rhodoferax saidenbachensis]APW42711.1 DsbA family protein [Rhodoferax saidenbachensis]
MSTPTHTTVTYLFDPLCGWCYGASPTVQQLGQHTSIQLELAPTGLFAGSGGRTLDAAFADYAWSNDVRIEKLTGQRFSEAYRTQVLGKPGSRFDSATTTLALTAVALTTPERELEALKVLQEGRYVHALDTSAVPVVEKLLRDMGLAAAADRLVAGDAELLAANAERIRKAQGLMQRFDAQGVPTLIVTDDNGSRLLRGNALYGSFDSLLSHIAAA